MQRRRASEHALASRSTPTTHRLVTICVVVVADLLTSSDRSSCANPDDALVDLDVTVRRAGVVDEAGDIASHRGVHYPCAIQLEAPDVPLGQLSLLAGNAVLRPELLAGVVDDPLVFRNRRSREHTPSVNTGASSLDPVGGRRRRGTDTLPLLGRCLLLGLDPFPSGVRSCTHLGRRRPTRARARPPVGGLSCVSCLLHHGLCFCSPDLLPRHPSDLRCPPAPPTSARPVSCDENHGGPHRRAMLPETRSPPQQRPDASASGSEIYDSPRNIRSRPLV